MAAAHAVAQLALQRLRTVERRISNHFADAAAQHAVDSGSADPAVALEKSEQAALSGALHTRRLRRRIYASLLAEEDPTRVPAQPKIVRGVLIIPSMSTSRPVLDEADREYGGNIPSNFFASACAVLDSLIEGEAIRGAGLHASG